MEEKRLSRGVLVSAFGLTCIIEAITAAIRFGMGLEATRDTQAMAAWTFGVRIHHSYIGVLVLVVALVLLKTRPRIQRMALVLGMALVASDLIHHFVVLWIWVGSPEFHLTYPAP